MCMFTTGMYRHLCCKHHMMVLRRHPVAQLVRALPMGHVSPPWGMCHRWCCAHRTRTMARRCNGQVDRHDIV